MLWLTSDKNLDHFFMLLSRVNLHNFERKPPLFFFQIMSTSITKYYNYDETRGGHSANCGFKEGKDGFPLGLHRKPAL